MGPSYDFDFTSSSTQWKLYKCFVPHWFVSGFVVINFSVKFLLTTVHYYQQQHICTDFVGFNIKFNFFVYTKINFLLYQYENCNFITWGLKWANFLEFFWTFGAFDAWTADLRHFRLWTSLSLQFAKLPQSIVKFRYTNNYIPATTKRSE